MDKIKDIDSYNMMLHDIKIPISILKNSIAVIEQYYDKGKLDELDLKEYLSSMRKNGNRVTKLLTNLLALYNNTYNLKFRSVDLYNVITNLIDEIKKNEQFSSIQFEIDECDDFPIVYCDVEQVERAYLNLISNSIKYGGKDVKIHINLTCDDKKTIVRFENNSPKIPEEISTEIFKPFVRNVDNKKIEGHGLGLAIVKKIVEDHDGTIYLDNDFAGGCAFVIEVPISSKKIKTLSQNIEHDLQSVIISELLYDSFS
jgi:signal transduction histidine kinase